jgi:hypothetical protein
MHISLIISFFTKSSSLFDFCLPLFVLTSLSIYQSINLPISVPLPPLTPLSFQICLGFLLSALSLCFSPLSLCLSPLSLYLCISPIYLYLSPLSFYVSHLSISVPLPPPPPPPLFPDKKFPALGLIPSF